MKTMNVVALNPTVSENLERTLARLPEFDPTGAGWLGVMAARRARAGMRRRRAATGFAVAAAAMLALAIALPLRVVAPGADVDDALATQVQRSRRLEQDLSRARGAGGNVALIAVEADLARVDGALQAAYDRGAGPVELEPLWRERTAALETLLAGYRHPDTLIRI
jgi:hypothetical protein